MQSGIQHAELQESCSIGEAQEFYLNPRNAAAESYEDPALLLVLERSASVHFWLGSAEVP